MKALDIFSLVFIISLKSLSQGEEKFQLTLVTYIKEIQGHEKIQEVEKNTVAETEEKRLGLCRDGFKQIQKHHLWSVRGKAVFLEGIATEKMKVYVLKEIDYYDGKATPAFKCPTDPESYIRILNNENENRPVFQVLHKRSPIRTLKRMMYQMMRVIEIVQVDATDMLSASENGNKGIWQLKIPVYDTEELTEEQRLQICIKGMQTCPKLNIELLKDRKTSMNKYYSVTMSRQGFKEIIEAFECPTEPKIYISVGIGSLKRGSLLVVIKTTDGDRQLAAVRKLKARSPKETAEAFYHQIRNANTDTKIDQIIDLGVQLDMCESIFKDIMYKKGKGCRSTWLKSLLKPTYYLDTYDELKKENHLREHYYKRSDSVFISGQDIVIVNGPESTDVMVPETEKSVLEDLFVCLIRTDGRHTEEYFVSKEYNMDNTKNSYDDFIAGRFFFKRRPNKSVVMMGMIEEFANVIETSNVELLYLKRRKNVIAQTDSEDPLCRLNRFERSRVCNLVFDFMIYEKFRPTPVHSLDCQKNSITFETEDGLKEAYGNQYDEWMISCYQSVPKDDSFKVYYLSQAYDKSDPSSSNDLFAYNCSSNSKNIILQDAYSDKRIGSLLAKS